MSDQHKFIVAELNKEPFNRNFNLISFDALNPEQFLQVLTDVLANIDPKNKVDIREEEPEQTVMRILGMLRVLKYKPPPEIASIFRQGLAQGEKAVLLPVLEWLLRKAPELKKRAYLAKYLVKVDVPPEILGDADVADLYEQYEHQIEDFKAVHKDYETLKSSGFSTAELRRDIEAMEGERDIVSKRIERMHRKVESLPNREAMLAVARQLRQEKEKEREIAVQKQEQQTATAARDQRIKRLAQQLRDLRQSAIGASPEGLLQRVEEETNVNGYLVRQKLPKELETMERKVQVLQSVIAEPAMTRADLDAINEKIQSVTSEVNRLVEQRLTTSNPAEDKLALFRQQAAIVGRRKVSTAEKLAELRQEVTSVEEEVKEKRTQLDECAGETVLRGEDFKRYVNRLRGRSSFYKRRRAELASLKAESGVLARTLEILKAREESLNSTLSVLEAREGVSGYRETEDRLEEVSGEKAEIDHQKGKSLEEMSSLVLQLTQKISSRKAQLAPIIKELRPLREECQEVTTEYEQKKHVYDSTAIGLESITSKLEQEVRALQSEIVSSESRFHVSQALTAIYKIKQQKVQEEIKLYASGNTGDKKQSMRELLGQKLAEAEKLSRQLKDEQRRLKENHPQRQQQMRLWSDLAKLMECKKKCQEEAKKGSGIVRREPGGETLVLQ